MSSTVQTEVVHRAFKQADQKRLVRASSLEKIRRFNSFICSQHYYYFLPAIFTWLKSSHSGLHSSTENTILFFRALFFSHFFYKLYKLDYRALYKQNANYLAIKLTQNSKVLMLAGVWLATGVLIFQLGVCLYCFLVSWTPAGLVFLIFSFGLIMWINYKTVSYQMRTIITLKGTKKTN